MIHLDLFSGIGGFSLAASRVWPDHKVVAFCEIDPFCQKVLKKHWPDVPIFDDIKTLKGSDFGTVDIISGGFPCQPFSAAGKRAGTKDDRHLWPEMLRVISEVRPRWVVAENVSGIVSLDKGMVLDTVLTDLEGEGYQVQPFIIPACAVNAPHRRDRIWIVAYDKRQRSNATKPIARNAFGSMGEPVTEGHGWKEKNSNAAHPTQQLPHRTRDTGQGGREEYSDSGGDAADTSGGRRQDRQHGCEQGGEAAECGNGSEAWDEPWHDVALRTCVRGMDDGASRGVDRTARLKALGNAVVVPLVEQIFKAIREAV